MTAKRSAGRSRAPKKDDPGKTEKEQFCLREPARLEEFEVTIVGRDQWPSFVCIGSSQKHISDL